jgi:mannose-6-phosphate isomerase-like protein (cupin superfamily)
MSNPLPSIGPREAMERLNSEAAKFHIWLRTQANAPAQRPRFRETGLTASGRIAGLTNLRLSASYGSPSSRYGAQLLRPGEATRFKRETASTLYIAIEGEGVTEVAGQCFGWRANDIFVVPGFAWRRHSNAGNMDAILYTVSDAPLLDKIGQYRAQGRLPDDTVAELVP